MTYMYSYDVKLSTKNEFASRIAFIWKKKKVIHCENLIAVNTSI